MNVVIGIIGRDRKIEGIDYGIISKNIIRYLGDKCSFIGIYDYNKEIDTEVLELCDGIIFTGGTDIFPYHYKVLEYAINRNIPVVGICMGEQIIGLYSKDRKEDDLKLVKGHLGTEHFVKVTPGSILEKIFGSRLKVNSRHNYVLEEVKEPFKVSCTSEDGVIEGIEYTDDEHFIVGVQWHPEDMENMNNLFIYLVKEALIRKLKKEL